MKRIVYLLIGISLVVFLFIAVIAFQKDYSAQVTDASNAKAYPPGIVLSFDDNYIDDWYYTDKRLRDYNWKATFFVCKYDSFTPLQKEKLQYLKNMGHDIAAHGYQHLNAVKYSTEYGMKRYIADEILPCKAAMKKDGFTVNSFAYPDGARNETLDKELLKHFDIIRGTTYGELPPASQFCYYSGNRVIYGLGIDDDYKQFNVAYYKRLMAYAKEHNKIVIFYGHKIVDHANQNLETPISALEEICQYAIDNKLKFYTIEDLKKLD